MENNENFVTEEAQVEVAENVENTTEETPKTYTEEEMNARVNEIVGKRVARKEAKIRKEYERKYGNLESVLRAGTGTDNVDEMTSMFTEHYEKRGVKIPQKPTYSDKDIDVLAAAEADDIIGAGFEEVVEEVDRLADIGVANMTAREKAVFKRLAEYRKATEEGRELAKIGVTKDVTESAEFKELARKFAPGTPITDIYDIYIKTQPKKDIKPMGSMRQTQGEKVKEYYSPEEIEKLSASDLKNPKVWDAVRRSMTGGK